VPPRIRGPSSDARGPSSDARGPAANARGPTSNGSDTKDRLLDAAEQLFAEHGFEGTSMRAVTQAADTSVSAANYHFGSKQALVAAALVRRLEPLNRKRLATLAEVEAAGNGAPPGVEAVLEAFLRPSFEAKREGDPGRFSYRHVAAQLYADPHETMAALKVEIFAPVIARFIDALAKALPDLAREELGLRFHFVIGAMIHVISGHADDLSEGDAREPADDAVLRQVVAFAAAGMRAPRTRHAAGHGAGARP